MRYILLTIKLYSALCSPYTCAKFLPLSYMILLSIAQIANSPRINIVRTCILTIFAIILHSHNSPWLHLRQIKLKIKTIGEIRVICRAIFFLFLLFEILSMSCIGIEFLQTFSDWNTDTNCPRLYKVKFNKFFFLICLLFVRCNSSVILLMQIIKSQRDVLFVKCRVVNGWQANTHFNQKNYNETKCSLLCFDTLCHASVHT